MKASFENTVNILVKAYLDDTLVHSDCSACAVGNLVAAGKGYTYKREEYEDEDGDILPGDLFWKEALLPKWRRVFMTQNCKHQYQNPQNYTGDAKDEIDATGYAWQELARIEYAFETAPKGKDDDEWMFNGLMSVVDTLADIHQIDLSVKESAKLLFVKA